MTFKRTISSLQTTINQNLPLSTLSTAALTTAVSTFPVTLQKQSLIILILTNPTSRSTMTTYRDWSGMLNPIPSTILRSIATFIFKISRLRPRMNLLSRNCQFCVTRSLGACFCSISSGLSGHSSWCHLMTLKDAKSFIWNMHIQECRCTINFLRLSTYEGNFSFTLSLLAAKS